MPSAQSTPKTPRLFSAKTRIPLPPPSFLSRAQLQSALRTGTERKLTLVVAPAGFGKTTAVAEYARALGASAAWLTLDSGDHDLSVFLHYLLTAIAQVRPGFGTETRTWLAATPAPASEVDTCAAMLVGELETVGGSPLVLFLDDFHALESSASVLRLLDLTLQYLPPDVHIVIGSRTGPALTITRLLVEQQISGFGADELRFSVGEADTWFAYRPDMPEPEQIARLVEATEGWITGLILQTAAGGGAVPEVPTAELYTYLLTEVLAHQTPTLQNFLLRASILDHLTAPLCAAVLDVPDAEDLLRQVHEDRLFLTALGGRETLAYRLHQLFREFLLTRLQAGDPGEVARLHHRAAGYFTQHGEYGQAMNHLFAAGDWSGATSLVEQVGQREIDAGRVESVERWLRIFPPTEVDARPSLLLFDARILMGNGKYAEAGEVLTRVERALAGQSDAPGRAEVWLLRARLAAARGDGRQMVEFTRQALANPSATPAQCAQAVHLGGIGYAILGEWDRSDEAFAEATAAFSALGDLQNTATVGSDWGNALGMRDEPSQAVDKLERALEYARQSGNLRLQTLVLNNLTSVYISRGELQRAESTVVAATELARGLRWQRMVAETLLSRAEIALEARGPRAAMPLYQEAGTIAERVAPTTLVGALAGLAYCLRRLGSYTEAARAARRGLDGVRVGEMAFEAAFCRLELGAATLVSAPEEALPLIRDATRTLATLGRKRIEARASAILATALWATYDFAAAAEELKYAVATSVESGSEESLAPELASLYGLPLLRRLAGRNERCAGLLSDVSDYLASEHETAPVDQEAAGPMQVVRNRPHILEVYSLGQAAVYRDGVAPARSEWQSATAKELFLYLVEYPDGQRKEVILAALWPDQTYARANNTFHTSLKRLRGALRMDVVHIEDNVYRINPALNLWHDGTEARALIDRARQTEIPKLARRWWAAGTDLMQGAFAEEVYRDWAGARRQFWQAQAHEALMWLANDALSRSAFEEATNWGQRLLANDATDESIHALLMRVFAAAGWRDRLTRQYKEVCQVLSYELDAEPSRATQELYWELQRQADHSSLALSASRVSPSPLRPALAPVTTNPVSDS